MTRTRADGHQPRHEGKEGHDGNDRAQFSPTGTANSSGGGSDATPNSVGERRRMRRRGAIAPSEPPALDISVIRYCSARWLSVRDDARVVDGASDGEPSTRRAHENGPVSPSKTPEEMARIRKEREEHDGLVIATLSPSMIRMHHQLINQGAGGLPELAQHMSKSTRAHGTPVPGGEKSAKGSPLLLLSPMANVLPRFGNLGGTPMGSVSPSRMSQWSPSSVCMSPMAGARLEVGGVMEASITPLADTRRRAAKVSSWWTGQDPYPSRRPASRASVKALLGSDEGWKVFVRPGDKDAGEAGEATVASSGSRRLRAPPSPPASVPSSSASSLPTAGAKRSWMSRAKGLLLFSSRASVDSNLSGPTQDEHAGVRVGETGGRELETGGKKRGSQREATMVFRVVHAEGVQYRKAPSGKRVWRRKWWDTKKRQAGPNFGDLVFASKVEGNWIQVAGSNAGRKHPHGYWLPIVGDASVPLLEVKEILGAYTDSQPQREEDTKRKGSGWNPLLSARSCVLSADRSAVHFPAGQTGVAMAEAGFDGGRHVTVLRILAMDVQAYIGVMPLPEDAQMVNSAHLGLFGFAVGAGSESHHKSGSGKTPATTPLSGLTRKPVTPSLSGGTGPALLSEQHKRWATKESPISGATSPVADSRADSVVDDQISRHESWVRVWLEGTLGHFVPAFKAGDQVALLLDMEARTLDYYVNTRFKGRITSQLPAGPLYPAVGSHQLAKQGTCFAASFNVDFQVSPNGHTITYTI